MEGKGKKREGKGTGGEGKGTGGEGKGKRGGGGKEGMAPQLQLLDPPLG